MAEGTTRRTADGSSVAWSDAIAAWASAGRPVLEGVARQYGSYLTYQQMAEAVQQKAGNHGRAVPALDRPGPRHDRNRAEFALGRTPLTALVVRADGTIGDGYAIPVEEREGAVPADLEMHAAEERLRCYRHFGAELPPDGGQATLTREVAVRRENARRNSPPQRRPVCPNCFLELPTVGICDNCAS